MKNNILDGLRRLEKELGRDFFSSKKERRIKIPLSYVKNPDFNDLTDRYPDDELARLDSLTPLYKCIIESLSPQQRAIIVSIICYGKPIRINELSIEARLWQQNRTSSQVSRLVRKEFLKKQDDGRYYFNPEYPDLERYLIMRCTGFEHVLLSIPDKKHPITYYIKNRETIDRILGVL